MSCYLHHVPGRIRIKTPFLKGSAAKALEIEKKLESVYGVRSAHANALTGSLLIRYEQSVITAKEILNGASREGYFDPAAALNFQNYMEVRLSKTGEAIGRAILSMAIGKGLEGSPLALLSAII
jgi:hypothetical protein